LNQPISRENRALGRWYVLAAAVLWSTSGLFVKSPWFDDWPLQSRGILLAFWRCLFAGLALVPFVRQPRWSWRLVPAGLLFLLMNVTYLTTMTRTTAANAIWLQYTAPLWVLLVGVGLFGESARRRDLWTIGLALLGVLVIVICEVRAALLAGGSYQGVIWGVVAGIAFAGVVLSLRMLRDLDSTWIVTVCLFTTAIFLAPCVVYWQQWPTYQQTPPLILFGVVQMGLPYVLFARGVRSISGHEASGILLLEPVLVPVWVFLVWHLHPGYQPPAAWTFIGGACILLGLLIRYLPFRWLATHQAKRNENV